MRDERKDLRFYRRMRFIRRFEETLLALFKEGLVNGTTHCYIGQEANAVGLFEHLREDDHVFSNHRCHGHYLAKTGDAFGLLAEIMGAAGIAMAMKLSASDRISVVCIGDGMMGEGVVYETLNIASLWALPLLVVLENNLWSQSTPIKLNTSGALSHRFAAFGIDVDEIRTTDVLEVDATAARSVAAVRREGRPRALIIETFRLCSHSKSSDDRPEEEVAARWETEPLAIHGPRLDDAERKRIDAEIEAELDALVRRAKAAP